MDELKLFLILVLGVLLIIGFCIAVRKYRQELKKKSDETDELKIIEESREMILEELCKEVFETDWLEIKEGILYNGSEENN